MNTRLLFVCAALTMSVSACSCGTSVKPDAGTKDSGMPVVDAGFDAGQLEVDAGFDAGVDAGPVELTVKAALPPRGAAAGGTSVLLSGSGFLHDFATTGSQAKPITAIKFGGNSVLDFQIIDDETIELRTPPGVTGKTSISFTNPNGRFICNGCFTYFDELVVTQVAPAQGPLEGGTLVTITGQGFTTDTQVLFGPYSSPTITFVSATQLTAIAPRGAAPGLVDVVVYNKNGVSTQRRAFRYATPLVIASVAPVTGALDGGTAVTLTGSGFTGATTVLFGALASPNVVVSSDTQLVASAPVVSTPGAVDVTVTTPSASASVKNAFTYIDPLGSFAVYAVYPHVVSAGDTVTLTGQALDADLLTVTFGGEPVAIGARTFSTAQLTVPARGAAPRVSPVNVAQVSDGSSGTSAVTWKLGLTSVTPATGSALGGTAVTATGSALPPSVEVRLGAFSPPAASVSVSGETGLAFTTPAGSGGTASELVVKDPTDPENQATLSRAFTFLEALTIGRVQPERGAISGGTLVTVYGSGFGDSTTVAFGGLKAKDLKVIDSHTLTCRIPKSNVGVVDVTVQKLTEHDTLPGGFSFYDPRSISGGLSGGPLVGTLNVTVLDSTSSNYGAPVPLATVMLGTDPTTPFQGQTDARGQITFSDPSLVKAQLVTAYLKGFETTSVTAVNAENLTVFMTRTSGGDGSSGPPPAGTPASVITGKVTGFKSPRPLVSGESLEARVFVAQTSLFGGPPFGGQPYKAQEKWRITSDGGDYLVYTGAGLRAVYAVLGIVNASAKTFTPVSMGVRRGITTSADNPASGEDVVLDMQLDQQVTVTIDAPVSYPDGTGTGGTIPAVNNLYAWLDLGAEGFIPNPNNWDTGLSGQTSVSSTGVTQTMKNFPQLDGSNFIFLNSAESPSFYPVSYYFRRQPGPLSTGVTIGPMLPAPNLKEPKTTFDGTISWVVDPGGIPDLHNVQILKPTLFGNVSVWNVVLPGTENQVVLPKPAVDKLLTEEKGNPLFIIIYSSRSPKFAYNQWTYDTLSGVTWSAFTMVVSDTFTP